MEERIRFGRFELQPVERRLLENGRAVALGARAFDVLLALIERRDRLVSKAELLDLVWPGLVVEEANLPVQVSGLRKLIGPQAIATVPGLGYRFAMAIDDDPAAEPRDAQHADQPTACTNVPAAIDVLLGREADIDTLARWLSAHRLVTVLGAGGIGKTRLVQAVARAVVGNHPDGVWWVDVAALTSPDKVIPSIAGAARLQLGDGDAQAQLVRSLGSREMLLVLDNCEHLAEPIAHIVGTLLAGAPGVRVLTTSQEALKVEGEHLYLLSALAVPPVGVSLSTARGFAAVQLLERRARATDARFSLTVDNVNLAIDLCRQLDGVALAIEMAAARLPLLGLDGLHQRLGERLSLLRTTSRDAPSRQRTLRTTLDWSHALLDANESAVLRRLAVFVGSFRLDAAQQAAAFAGLDADAVLEALAGLVDKSLVKLEQLEPPRYRLAETIRLYARERLHGACEVELALRSHDEALVRVTGEVERSPLQAPQLLQLYAPEYLDVSQVFDRAIERQDAEIAAAAVLFLRSIDHLRGDLSRACQRVLAIDTLKTFATPAAEAKLSYFVACCSWFRGRIARIDAARNAVRLWRQLDDEFELYRSLSVLALESAQAGDLEEAQTAIAEAVRIEKASWPARWRAERARRESLIASCRGDEKGSKDLAVSALKLYQQAGAHSLVALMRLEVADATLAAGDVAESIAITRMAVDELRGLGIQSFTGVALTLLCKCCLVSGDLLSARRAAIEALPLLEEIHGLVDLIDPLAWLAATDRQFETAARLIGYSDALHGTNQLPRDPLTLRVVTQAAARTRVAIGAVECSRLRATGAEMSSERAASLMRSLLDHEPRAISASVKHTSAARSIGE